MDYQQRGRLRTRRQPPSSTLPEMHAPPCWELKPTSARKTQQAQSGNLKGLTWLLLVRYWPWDVGTRIIYFILPSTPSNTLIPLALWTIKSLSFRLNIIFELLWEQPSLLWTLSPCQGIIPQHCLCSDPLLEKSFSPSQTHFLYPAPSSEPLPWKGPLQKVWHTAKNWQVELLGALAAEASSLNIKIYKILIHNYLTRLIFLTRLWATWELSSLPNKYPRQSVHAKNYTLKK